MGKKGSPDFHDILATAERFDIGKVPAIVLLDFAAAFPSVAHAWMFAVINAIGMPIGFRNAIGKMYENVSFFTKTSLGYYRPIVIFVE